METSLQSNIQRLLVLGKRLSPVVLGSGFQATYGQKDVEAPAYEETQELLTELNALLAALESQVGNGKLVASGPEAGGVAVVTSPTTSPTKAASRAPAEPQPGPPRAAQAFDINTLLQQEAAQRGPQAPDPSLLTEVFGHDNYLMMAEYMIGLALASPTVLDSRVDELIMKTMNIKINKQQMLGAATSTSTPPALRVPTFASGGAPAATTVNAAVANGSACVTPRPTASPGATSTVSTPTPSKVPPGFPVSAQKPATHTVAQGPGAPGSGFVGGGAGRGQRTATPPQSPGAGGPATLSLPSTPTAAGSAAPSPAATPANPPPTAALTPDELAREEVCAAFLTEKLAGLVGRTVTAIECAAAARVLSPATRGPKVVAAVKTVYRTLVPGAKEIKGFDKLGFDKFVLEYMEYMGISKGEALEGIPGGSSNRGNLSPRGGESRSGGARGGASRLGL